MTLDVCVFLVHPVFHLVDVYWMVFGRLSRAGEEVLRLWVWIVMVPGSLGLVLLVVACLYQR